MFTVISDKNNLIAVFQKYSVSEALQVKYNLQNAISSLNIPSPTLLASMAAEGLSLDDFDGSSKNQHQVASADSVLRSHLKPLFLDLAQLKSALASLSMRQAIEIRDVFSAVMPYLKLPSESLLAQMEQEGLSLNRLGVKNVTPQATVSNDKLQKTKSLLGQALQQDPAKMLLQQQIAAAKAKLQNATINTADVSKAKALLSSALESKTQRIEPIAKKPELSLVSSSDFSESHSMVKHEESTTATTKISLQEALERALASG
ncbi:hypothetical protein [Pseudoalteromonas tunicata]|jgi:hypothetical protein|uniref:Uncharacterized protein n=1 Tax=Pseudoalteromonas tunicata D2 TaxID=87626 RepID=A4C3U1_9GAMM|nr:hypothetical protein [Pseudoalteromonas tunicata]ATC96498.1 hypothetical protein PTUN_b0023 [Pseudoalteromonas tunicata]AXT33371.1 hypothetical protein D1819_21495 [Pseudoalteromonas tunicata]EAR30223.1 hypothetical protein PTD2_01601 [Pseudoalteromonas tunicata D2]